MFRVLFYCLIIFPIAAVSVWLVQRPGRFSANWLGYHIEMNTSLAVVIFFFLVGSALLFARWTGIAVRGPETFVAYRKQLRLARGYTALSQGMVAVAAGDSAEVRKLAKQAHRLLDEPALTLLLSAQAAQLDGDEGRAERYFREMLDVESTEFLGLRGLFIMAARRGNQEAALDYAERAAALRPDTPWVGEALFELNSAQQNWGAAADLLENSVKAKTIGKDVARRKRAVLYTEQAIAEDASSNAAEALSMASQALDLAPGFGPAAVVAAKHLINQGKTWKAAEVIETAWNVGPHPDLATLYGKIKSADTDKARAKWVRGLAKFNKDHVESRLLRARQNINLGQWKSARRSIDTLLESFASVRVCELMADIEKGEHGRSEVVSEAARAWLAKAVVAPRDAHWMCGTCGREAPAWSAVCNNCGAFDDLDWRAPREMTLVPIEGDSDVDESTGALLVLAEEAEEESATGIEPSVVDSVLLPQKSKEGLPQAAFTRRSDEARQDGGRDFSDLYAPDDPGPGGSSSDDPFDPRPEKITGQDL
jgi:HemY protein